MRVCRQRRGYSDCDDGASAVEFSILALPFLLVIFLLIQGALWLYGRSVALDSAREGVSQLRLAQTVDACNAQAPRVQAYIATFAHNVGSGALIDPRIDPPVCGSDTVSVTVRGRAVSLVPGLNLTIAQVANGQIEKFEAPP
jgi:Flp pilus assembly protein TadG